MTIHNIVCNQEGIRIDKYLSDCNLDLSRAALAGLIENNNVTVNGKTVSKNYKIKINDEIQLEVPEPKAYEAKAENIELDIVFEDKWLLVVNKPKGMVVHPAPGNYEHTLVNALMYHCGDSLSGINGVMRP